MQDQTETIRNLCDAINKERDDWISQFGVEFVRVRLNPHMPGEMWVDSVKPSADGSMLRFAGRYDLRHSEGTVVVMVSPNNFTIDFYRETRTAPRVSGVMA